MKNQIITIRVSEEIKESLELLSHEEGIPMSDIVRKAIVRYAENPIDKIQSTFIRKEDEKFKIISSRSFVELILWFHYKRDDIDFYNIPNAFNYVIQNLNNAYQITPSANDFLEDVDDLSENLVNLIEFLNTEIKKLVLSNFEYDLSNIQHLNSILNKISVNLKLAEQIFLFTSR